MKGWLLTALLGLVTAGTAQAHDWRLFYDKDDSRSYVDDARLDKEKHTGWFKLLPKQGPLAKRNIILSEEADCIQNRYRILHYDVYTLDGKHIESSDAPDIWLPAIPNTCGEEGVKLMCGQ